MIYSADAKRTGDGVVFSLDIRKRLAVGGAKIVSVTSYIEAAAGYTDINALAMLIGQPTFRNTIVMQRVEYGVDGNYYNLKFRVVTTKQTIEFIINIPVTNEAAFV
jgi:alcohol dehydrogenase YqhD (iron-dependent ADH family)